MRSLASQSLQNQKGIPTSNSFLCDACKFLAGNFKQIQENVELLEICKDLQNLSWKILNTELYTIFNTFRQQKRVLANIEEKICNT